MRRLLVLALTVGVAAAACAAPRAAEPTSEGDDAISRRQYDKCKKYTKLSETGLFERDREGKMTDRLAPGVTAFRPRYELWSDGAAKRRWLRLPPGAKVDTHDMDHWRLPKGTKLWKEFSVDGARVETRLVEIGCEADTAHPERGSGDFFFGAFVWNGDDATLAVDGLLDANGKGYDVPSQDACVRCHSGEPGAVLGVSALQLSGEGLPLLLDALPLSDPPPDGVTYRVPGDDVAREALGFLHANCGHCHTEGGRAFDVVHQQLRLSVADARAARAEDTSVFKSIVDQPVQVRLDEARPFRVKRGEPEASFVLFRMTDPALRMPPGTKTPAPHGVSAVKRWIEALASGGGGGAPSPTR